MPVNTPPSGADSIKTILEDTPYAFATTDFGFSDTDGNAFAAVEITTLPSAGSFTLNGAAVGADDAVSVTEIDAGHLVFTPAANANGAGYASFTFQVQDDGGADNGGVDTDPTPNTLTFDVTPVNDPPTGFGANRTFLEDTAYTFTANDFQFIDAEGNALAGVKITTLPTNGLLTLNGASVSAGDTVSAVDIAAGDLVFTPQANASGINAASFTFQVQDDGGTANGGVDTDPNPQVFSFNIIAVNDPPSGSDGARLILEDAPHTMGAADFGFHDADGNALAAVTITTLPGAGSLTLNGAAVNAGDSISVADITAGDLVFTPAAGAHGQNYASFTFQVQDNGGTVNGGIDTDPTPNTLTFDLRPAGYIPDDPLFAQQWNLLNVGQSGGTPGVDINVTQVWTDYTGQGVKVAVYDDGVDFNHEDLKDNYDHADDVIIDGSPSDAFWQSPSQVGGTTGFNALNAHGTTLAGAIAAENNGIGGVGVAFDASLTGVYAPILGLPAPSTEAVQAIQQMGNFDVVDMASGGPIFRDGTGNANWAPIFTAIDAAAANGRGGLGTIMVNAVHNSGPGFGGFDSNFSQFDSSPDFIHVGGVDDNGYVVQYVTRGTTMLVSALTGPPVAPGSGNPHNIVTTDITGADGIGPGDFTDSNGTSMASPQVAGVAALLLQANPNLGWRDVQDILSLSARHTGSAIGDSITGFETDPWTFNGADDWNGGGLHYSRDYGFGLVDALAAVRLAETWNVTGAVAETSANQTTSNNVITTGTVAIPDNTGSAVTLQFNVTDDIRIEEVQLRLGVTHQRAQDLQITLTAPDGTVSDLFDAPTSTTTNPLNGGGWRFTDEAFRGELSAGTWTVTIQDIVSGNTGSLISQSNLVFLGASDTSDERYVYTDEFGAYGSLAGRNLLTDTDGGNDTINAAAVTPGSHIDLNQGATSTIAGQSLTIAAGSDIENAIGGDGNDTLIGNALDNVLAGGRGNDSMAGGGGADKFVYTSGADVVTDFSHGEGDHIDLSAVAGISTFGDVLAHASQLGADTVLDFGGGDTLTLNHAVLTSLTAGDFGMHVPPAPDISDMDGNGVNDLVFQSQSTVDTLYAAMPGGTLVDDIFPALSGVDATQIRAAGSGDIDGNGSADIVYQIGDNIVGKAAGDIATTFTPMVFALPDGWTVSGVGDVNGDGAADILITDATNDAGRGDTFFFDVKASLATLNTASPHTVASNLATPGADYAVRGIGDINGDGVNDVVFQSTADGDVIYADMAAVAQHVAASNFSLNDTLHVILSTSVIDASLVVKAVGDLDGDGLADLVVEQESDPNAGPVHSLVLEAHNGGSDAFTFQTVAGFTDYGAFDVRGIADVTGDGIGDILMQYTQDLAFGPNANLHGGVIVVDPEHGATPSSIALVTQTVSFGGDLVLL